MSNRPPLPPCRGRALAGQHPGDQPQGHVKGEQPGPVQHGQDAAADGRSGGHAGGHDQGAEAQRSTKQSYRKNGAVERRPDAEHGRGAESLQAAHGDQRGHGVGQSAAQGGGGEHRQAHDIHAAIADDIAQGGEAQQAHGVDQPEGVGDPDGGGGRGVQIVGDGGQGDVDDGAVQDGHQGADDQDGDGDAALGAGQTLVTRFIAEQAVHGGWRLPTRAAGAAGPNETCVGRGFICEDVCTLSYRT